MIRAGDSYRAGPGVAVAVPTFDFETFSAAGYQWDAEAYRWRSLPGIAATSRGLEVVGVRNYIAHPTFEVLALNYELLDGQAAEQWHPPYSYETPLQRLDCDWTQGGVPWPALFNNPPGHPYRLLCHVARGGLLEAWNVGFEWWVWNEYCVPTWGWPPLKIEQLRCAMAKARSHALPGALKRAGQVLQLPHQKDPDGERLLNKFSKPRQPTKKDLRWRIRPEDDPADAAKLYSYNATDVVSEIEASLRTPDLSPAELRIWQVDQLINRRGLQVNVSGVEDCIAIVEAAHAKYNAELRTITAGVVQEASEVEALKRWLGSRGCHMDSVDEDAVEAMLKRCTAAGSSADGYVVRVLKIRQMLGSASVKKLFAFRYQNLNGRLYDLYSYFAARTARWTGNGPQPQNMPKGFFKTVEECERALRVIASRCLEAVELEYPDRTALEVISSCLRGLLIAAPGHDLICSDFSAIEGVVAACITLEQWRIDVFRTHGKIYEASASRICKIPFEDFIEHKRRTGLHHPMRNKIGKYAELGSGFGGWVGAWKNFGADEFLTDPEIADGIKAWRAASPRFPETWGGQSRRIGYKQYRQELFGLEGAMISAISHPGHAFRYGCISYEVADGILYCRVPSGGLITYHRPRLEPSQRFSDSPPWEVSISYEGDNRNPKMGAVGWTRMDVYGGKAFENVVQRIARDCHATGLVALEDAGYRPVLHSHDEPCGEVPEGWGSVEEFESIVNRAVAAQEWMRLPDGTAWPVSMRGGWRGKIYGKFD